MVFPNLFILCHVCTQKVSDFRVFQIKDAQPEHLQKTSFNTLKFVRGYFGNMGKEKSYLF